MLRAAGARRTFAVPCQPGWQDGEALEPKSLLRQAAQHAAAGDQQGEDTVQEVGSPAWLHHLSSAAVAVAAAIPDAAAVPQLRLQQLEPRLEELHSKLPHRLCEGLECIPRVHFEQNLPLILPVPLVTAGIVQQLADSVLHKRPATMAGHMIHMCGVQERQSATGGRASQVTTYPRIPGRYQGAAPAGIQAGWSGYPKETQFHSLFCCGDLVALDGPGCQLWQAPEQLPGKNQLIRYLRLHPCRTACARHHGQVSLHTDTMFAQIGAKTARLALAFPPHAGTAPAAPCGMARPIPARLHTSGDPRIQSHPIQAKGGGNPPGSLQQPMPAQSALHPALGQRSAAQPAAAQHALLQRRSALAGRCAHRPGACLC